MKLDKSSVMMKELSMFDSSTTTTKTNFSIVTTTLSPTMSTPSPSSSSSSSLLSLPSVVFDYSNEFLAKCFSNVNDFATSTTISTISSSNSDTLILYDSSLLPSSSSSSMLTVNSTNNVIGNHDERNHMTNNLYCPSVWDSLLCWDSVPAGYVVKVACSQVFGVMDVPIPDSNEFQVCGTNGSWINGTNYTECLPFLDSSTDSNESILGVFVACILFFGSFISLALLLISLFIFYHFKSLICTRLRVHRNLFVALIIHSALLIIISSAVVMKQYFPFKYAEYSWLCRIVVIAKLYSSMASVNWMFVEGLLLHTKLNGVFLEGPPFLVYHMIGWGLPAMIITVWSSIMVYTLDTSCWTGYSKTSYIWILTIPMFLALIINAIFLANIIRILVVKIKDTMSGEMKKALRATALLFPLLGMNQLLFCVNPEGELEEVYLLFNSILQSSQGMVVSILYCFYNTQVKQVIKAAYCRHIMVRNINSTIRVNNNNERSHHHKHGGSRGGGPASTR